MVLVFGLGFVFLGVGSGNSGLGDLFSGNFSLFGGSSGPSISKARERVEKNPKSAAAHLKLGEALLAHRRTDEAIAAYEQAARLNRKSVEALNQLSALYEQRSREQLQEAQLAQLQAQQLAPAGAFQPPASSKLGQALASFSDPIAETATTAAQERAFEAFSSYQATRQQLVSVYERLADLSPDDPSSLLQLALAAEQAGDLQKAIETYKRFVKRFPDDTGSVAEAKRQIKALERQLRSTQPVVTSRSG